jgi:hypothetical protein
VVETTTGERRNPAAREPALSGLAAAAKEEKLVPHDA